MVPQRIIWHHSADGSNTHQFDKINAYHKTKGFPVSQLGFFVGYHWLIEPDGTVKRARMENEIGAHDAGENTNSIGICLAGNFNLSLPTEAQTASASRLLGEIRTRWKIPITRIEPHRWDDDTDCPGQRLPDIWLVRQYLKRDANIMVRLFINLGEKFGLL